MNHLQPPWAQLDAESFDRFGLIAERRIDGSTVCNLPVIGGLAGLPVPPEWDRPCAETEMLALSIVHRMIDHPDAINAPLARYVTPRMKDMSQFTSVLDDGTRVSAPELVLSKHLQMACMNNDVQRDSLTLPIAEITAILVDGIRHHYG